MNLPENLKYTNEHEWIKIDGDFAYIGITDYAQKELGDIVFIEVETEGDDLAKGDTFGTIEAVKTVSDLFMPLNGEIVEVNAKLEESPEVVNSDPYGDGWMVKTTIGNTDDLKELLSAEDYAKLIS